MKGSGRRAGGAVPPRSDKARLRLELLKLAALAALFVLVVVLTACGSGSLPVPGL